MPTTNQESTLDGMTIETLLAQMLAANASDLFVTEGKKPAIRVNGRIEVLATATEVVPDAMTTFLAGLLTAKGMATYKNSGDLDVGYSLPSGQRFRLNLYRQQGRQSLVARSLPSGAMTFEELGLPSSIKKLTELTRGLVIISGATGSGKSTTLAAIIHAINLTRPVHIVTIEEPIEFIHQDITARISQREIGTDTESFHSALKHVVRESPDVILIGEMRDAETMNVALSAALTGHLVFATLHTVDTTQTLQRILAYYPEHLRFQVATDLALSLQAVVSQRLLPRKDQAGRVVAVEILRSTPAVARLLREQRMDELIDLMNASTDPDIHTFDRSLLALYQQDSISLAMGLAYATNADAFALLAQGMTTGIETFRTSGAPENLLGIDLHGLLRITQQRGASDLHLAEGRPPIIRKHRQLIPLEYPALSDADMRRLLYSILTGRQRSIYELEKEIDFALALENGQRFRVNAYFQRGKMAAAMRAVPTVVPNQADLALPDALIKFAYKPHGLLLVVGPTGSGKSTTMSCLVGCINHARACRIVTVEDPIEYVHVEDKATIDQREVHADTKSFGAALKYVLRQDPDVIMIGEMRDLETIASALTAAETGHLVLATLHTNDATSAINRMVDVFPPYQQQQVRSQLAACLLGVLSQRLLPRADSGYLVPVCEIMVATPAIRTLIRDNKMHQALAVMETSRNEGMQTMDAALENLYRRGIISHDEALRYLSNPMKLSNVTVTPLKK
jgi:twitching motility protein PilT